MCRLAEYQAVPSVTAARLQRQPPGRLERRIREGVPDQISIIRVPQIGDITRVERPLQRGQDKDDPPQPSARHQPLERDQRDPVVICCYPEAATSQTTSPSAKVSAGRLDPSRKMFSAALWSRSAV